MPTTAKTLDKDDSVEEDISTIVVSAPERSALAMQVKRIVQALFLALVTPRLLIYRLNRLVWGGDRAFLAASESLSRIPGMRGVYSRQAFFSATLAACGQDVYFGFGTLFSMTAARIGDRAYIGRQCSIGFADIGADALLADQVVVLSGGREHGQPDGSDHKGREQRYSRVKIGQKAWIGSGSVIMADVGEGSMIGAGSVVNRPIPSGCIAAGVPARVIRSYDRSAPSG